MLADDRDLWRLLRALDDPEHLEHPADFDGVRERARFESLVERIEADFGCSCEVDRDFQDASLLGRATVPAAATETGRALVVSVSNFGGLAVLTDDEPTLQGPPAPISAHDAERVAAVLTDLDHTLVPEAALLRRYDGAAGRRAFGPRGTWWIRYFDYL